TNIDTVVGPVTAGGFLAGLDAVASWDLPAAATDAGVYSVATRPALPLHFLGFAHLIGGADTDTFNVPAPGGSTTIDARAGDDVIAVGSPPAPGGSTGAQGGLTGDRGEGTHTPSGDATGAPVGKAGLDGNR